MTTKLCSAAVFLAMNLFAVAAQSAPFGSAESAKVIASGRDGTLANIAYRRCWEREGSRHCRWHRDYRDSHRGYLGLGYYQNDASQLPYGNAAWWRQMLRENRVRN